MYFTPLTFGDFYVQYLQINCEKYSLNSMPPQYRRGSAGTTDGDGRQEGGHDEEVKHEKWDRQGVA
jgi:hypothetical protein